MVRDKTSVTPGGGLLQGILSEIKELPVAYDQWEKCLPLVGKEVEFQFDSEWPNGVECWVEVAKIIEE